MKFYLALFFFSNLINVVVGPALQGLLRQYFVETHIKPRWIYPIKHEFESLSDLDLMDRWQKKKKLAKKYGEDLSNIIFVEDVLNKKQNYRRKNRIKRPHLDLPPAIENEIPMGAELEMPYRSYEIYLLDHPVPASDSVAAEESISYYDSEESWISDGAVRTASRDPMIDSANRAASFPAAVVLPTRRNRKPYVKRVQIP